MNRLETTSVLDRLLELGTGVLRAQVRLAVEAVDAASSLLTSIMPRGVIADCADACGDQQSDCGSSHVSHGEVASWAEPCGRAYLTVQVENLESEPREIGITIEGALNSKIEPAVLELGPFGRAEARLSCDVRHHAGTSVDLGLVVVKGCRVHFVRWTGRIGYFGIRGAASRLSLRDGRASRHAWWHHFRQSEPCADSHAKPMEGPA